MIDRVVAVIRGAKDDDDSKAKLMAQLKYVPHGASKLAPIDDVQAQHIFDMALKRINALNRLRIDEEVQQKGSRIDEITAILGSAGGVANIVRAELNDVRRRFGRPRRTVISAESTTEAAEIVSTNGKAKAVVLASALAEDVWAYVTTDGYTLVTPRNSKAHSSAPIRVAGSAALVAVAATRSDQRLLIFTEQGQAVRATLSDQPIGRGGAGKPVLSLLGRTPSPPSSAGPMPRTTCLFRRGARSSAYRPRQSPTPLQAGSWPAACPMATASWPWCLMARTTRSLSPRRAARSCASRPVPSSGRCRLAPPAW